MASELKRAVASCAIVADKGNIPIMSSIRVVSDGKGMVEFAASDTVQTVLARIACDGEASFCINAQSLAMKAKTLRDGQVELTADDRMAKLVSGRTKWQSPILPVNDWPDGVAKRPTGQTIALPEWFLRDATRLHAHADDVKEFVMGVCIDGAHMVATCGKTMGVVGGMPESTIRITLPTTAIGRLGALGESAASLTTDGKSAVIDGDHVSLITLLVEPKFPAWRAVLPELPHSVIIGRAELVAAIGRATAIKTENNKTDLIGVRMSINDDEITIVGENMTGERGDDGVAHAGRDGPDVAIGFAAHRLLGGLATMSAETLRLSYTTENMKAIRVESAVPGGREDYALIMPFALRQGFGE